MAHSANWSAAPPAPPSLRARRPPHSGTTVWRWATMTEMLAQARTGAFDLLLAGYSDRWQRDLRQTLELLEDGLHPAGVARVIRQARSVGVRQRIRSRYPKRLHRRARQVSGAR